MTLEMNPLRSFDASVTAKLHGVISQKARIFVFRLVKTRSHARPTQIDSCAYSYLFVGIIIIIVIIFIIRGHAVAK